MEESEVDKYTPLQSASMNQTLWVPYEHDIQVLGYFLHSYYAQIDVEFPNEGEGAAAESKARYDIKFLIEGQIEVLYFRQRELLQVQWLTSPKNDLIADSICLLILQIKENPTPQLVQMT